MTVGSGLQSNGMMMVIVITCSLKSFMYGGVLLYCLHACMLTQ